MSITEEGILHYMPFLRKTAILFGIFALYKSEKGLTH